MTHFKVIDKLNTLHIADFQLEKWCYQVYFSGVKAPQELNFLLPDSITLECNTCFEIAFDCIDNQLNERLYGRIPVGRKSILVFRRVVKIILNHFQIYKPGLYTFEAADEELLLFYRSLLRILIGRLEGFSVRHITGGKNYVIKTPAYCNTAAIRSQ